MKRKLQCIIIAFILISTIYCMNISKSRYLSEINIENNVSVAIPQIVLDTTNTQLTTTIMPGDTTSVEFYVKNYENNKINEVQMEYYLDLNITNPKIPLTYKIYKITGNNETELNHTTSGFGPIMLNYGTEEDSHFKIIFNWDAANNSISYAGQNFQYEIEVNATQVI